MTEPGTEQVMAAIVDVLSGLSGVRPGGWEYVRTPSVKRGLLPPGTQMRSDDLPRIYVVPGRATRLKRVGAATHTYQVSLNVDIHGMIESDPTDLSVSAETWRWRLREDMLQTLHQNFFQTLSLNLPLLNVSVGSAQDVILGERPEDVDSGELFPKVWWMVPITVWFLQSYATAA